MGALYSKYNGSILAAIAWILKVPLSSATMQFYEIYNIQEHIPCLPMGMTKSACTTGISKYGEAKIQRKIIQLSNTNKIIQSLKLARQLIALILTACLGPSPGSPIADNFCPLILEILALLMELFLDQQYLDYNINIKISDHVLSHD